MTTNSRTVTRQQLLHVLCIQSLPWGLDENSPELSGLVTAIDVSRLENVMVSSAQICILNVANPILCGTPTTASRDRIIDRSTGDFEWNTRLYSQNL